jgi:hypothetical protein
MTTHMTQMPARRVRGILAAVCVGAIGVAGLMSLAPKAHAASSCSDVELVFARGTAEPAGVGRVGQAFVDDLESQPGGNPHANATSTGRSNSGAFARQPGATGSATY